MRGVFYIFKQLDFWIFLFSLAVIHGVSFHLITVTDPSEITDCISYLGLAEFDFDTYEVRKYRIVIPFLAAGINYIFGDLFQLLSPWTFPGDFSLGMSFLIVNNLFLALTGVMVFKYVYAHSGQVFASFIGLVSFLTCRWTGFIAGLPLVDSFYILVLSMVLLGFKTRNRQLLIATIFLGPWAKEAFLFIAPIIFFYAPVKKSKQILYFLISGVLVFSSRFLIDYYNNTSGLAALGEDLNHFANFMVSFKRLFSFHGVYEIFSVTGVWIVLLIPALVFGKLKAYLRSFHGFEWWYIASVVLQALISTEIARMLYLLTPVLAVLWARVVSDFVVSGYQFPIKRENL